VSSDRGRLAVLAGLTAAILLTAGALVAVRLQGDADAGDTTQPTTPTGAIAWPLTGLPVGDEPGAGAPVLVVKIDNAQPAARPQSGLNQADVVYEEMVEGSVTRFAALFHSAGADPVGPIRSARSTDVALLTPLDGPLFAWAGANPEFTALVRAAPLVDVGFEVAADAYERTTDRHPPYNLYSSTDALRAHTPEGAGPPPQLFEYRTGDGQAAGREVSWVNVNFGGGPGSAPVDWTWDAVAEGWARAQAGTPHVDQAGEQITPANVVIQFVPYEIVGCCDASGASIPEGQLIGEGDAWLLSAGRLVEGRWQKPSADAVTTYTDPAGIPFRLTPGPTWVVLAPPGTAHVVG
jgi:Protein of unknown function (DUF3048) N-terminal domain/Protein of unknown function (DUF3048) C-terminal domain